MSLHVTYFQVTHYQSQSLFLLRTCTALPSMKKKMCQMVLPLLSAFGVGFYLENLPAPVAVILLLPSSSLDLAEARLHRGTGLLEAFAACSNLSSLSVAR
jgi:hypothetical protein